ncbi:MAG: hypothetical protein ACYDIA_03310 [Candidatus Humimicrobiaceae bacterium]
MNIRIITVLIILTLIFIAIFFYFNNQDSSIASIIITQDSLNSALDTKAFTDKTKEIFILIKLSKVKKSENIKISWYKKSGNDLVLIQENNVMTDNEGSGYIRLSLISKNSLYESGSYSVNIVFNGKAEKPKGFTIN